MLFYESFHDFLREKMFIFKEKKKEVGHFLGVTT